MQNHTIPTNKSVLRPLSEVIRKGNTVRVYVNERPNATTTAYTAGLATGDFTKDGRPVLEPIPPTIHSRYDFYLADTKVSFLRLPSDKNVISRRVNRAGGIPEVDMGKMRTKL